MINTDRQVLWTRRRMIEKTEVITRRIVVFGMAGYAFPLRPRRIYHPDWILN